MRMKIHPPKKKDKRFPKWREKAKIPVKDN
jgi:hypothetical protein